MHRNSSVKPGDMVTIRIPHWTFSPEACQDGITFDKSDQIWTNTRVFLPAGDYKALSEMMVLDKVKLARNGRLRQYRFWSPVRVILETPHGPRLAVGRHCTLVK